MKGSKLPYIAFLALLLLFNGLIFLVPYLASQGDPIADSLYAAFSPSCHQMISRSLCLFVSSTGGAYSIGDCMPEGAASTARDNVVYHADKTGYKLPVCARDVAIYLAMLLGLILLPFIMKIESEDWPNKWILAAAAVPIAIDGFTQLLGMRESTNLLRIITGAIIGIVLPFYLLPILNTLYAVVKEQIWKAEKRKK